MALVYKGRKLNGQAWLAVPGTPIATSPPPGGTVTPPPVTTPPPVVISGGSTAPLTSLNASDQRRVFNRDVYTDNPPGFSTNYNKGWAAIPVIVTSSTASNGLWMRLHNAEDPAAQQNVAGSGAVLQPAVQVSGVTGLVVGSNSVTILVPAALAWYYLDIAPDAAMTNPSRIAKIFGVGAVFGVGPGTSHGAAFTSTWAYDSTGATVPPISQMVDISPYGVVYAPGDPSTDTNWQVPGNTGVSGYPTTGAAEFLRLCCKQLRVNCAMVGFMERGGNSFTWNTPYDTRQDHAWGHLQANLSHAGKWEGQLSLCGANDAGVPSTRGELYKNMRQILNTVRALNSNPTPFDVVCADPILGGSTNASGHWAYFHKAERDLEVTRSATVNNEWYDAGGMPGAGINNVGGHTTMQGRIRMLRQFYRLAMGMMGTAKGGFALRRGPRLTSATRSGTTITLTVTHDGGTALKKVAWAETNSSSGLAYTDIDTTSTPDSKLAYLFSVYTAGNDSKSASKLALATTSVQLVDATTIKLFLASDPGAGVSLDVYHAMDFDTSATTNIILCDDTNDGDGLNYGRPMPRTLDPIYVPAPTPASQAITLTQPVPAVPGAWLWVSGTGTGASLNNAGSAAFSFASSVEVSVGGGAYAVPDALMVRNDNTWSGLALIPVSATPGSTVTVAVRRAGQASPDDSKTVTIVSARNELPDPDGTGALRAAAVGIWDAMNRSTLWQDWAKKTPAGHLQVVRVWQDALGNAANDIAVPVGNTDPGGAPLLDMRKNVYSNNISDITKHRPYVQIGGALAAFGVGQTMALSGGPALAGITGDATLFFVLDNPAAGAGNNWFSAGYIPPGFAANQFPGYSGFVGLGNYSFTRRDLTRQPLATPAAGYVGLLDCYIARYVESTKTLTVQSKSGTVNTTDTLLTTSPSQFNRLVLGGVFQGPQYGLTRLHQMVWFNRALSDTEMASLMTWSAAKWPYP